ncbi:MAG: hydrogenase expression/formation protein [Zoogloeaceae bacterium]|jgi:hydrogenase-1 operon protein HyaF|nr:hydrogenase expression/formation protein [Zoogloeaceae bacterium]
MSKSSFPPSRPFPIPVVTDHPHATTGMPDGVPEYLSMPNDMAVFTAPRVPESAERATLDSVERRLAALLARMAATDFAEADGIIEDLRQWPPAERALVGDLLGFGEVSAYTMTSPLRFRAQETAFPGLWRVLALAVDESGQECIEEDFLQAGAIPPVLLQVMRENGLAELPPPAFPEGVMNAPALTQEISTRAKAWRPDEPAHVINFTLLPMSEADFEALYGWLGHREVSILSRGYGNCRITSTRLAHVWWVQYFNSMDTLILNTLEVTAMPEAALAAREDYADTLVRLEEYLGSLKS